MLVAPPAEPLASLALPPGGGVARLLRGGRRIMLLGEGDFSFAEV